MNWAAIQRYTQPFVLPRWLETWRVRSARRKCPLPPNVPIEGPRRLYIDVSVISKHDAATGIQRTVRAVAHQLLSAPPAGWDVIAVGATRKRPYHRISWPPEAQARQELAPIIGRPGDVFLGLDFALDTVRVHSHHLADFKHHGGQLWFLMYDLLPAQHPHWFSDKLIVRYRKWLGVLASQADGFYCISPPVESELKAELERSYALVEGFRTHVLPMGADLGASRPSRGLPEGFDRFVESLRADPAALMVGTLEPRKGHSDVLDAFDLLWESGAPNSLVIVGQPGWKTEELQARLSRHPQLGKRLFWLSQASDEALGLLYESCHGVIAASYAEGFGLPVIETLRHGKPVLARALPVFQLHNCQGVTYFPTAASRAELAEYVSEWIRRQHPAAPAPASMATWADTARSIMSALDPASLQAIPPHPTCTLSKQP
jgi:glycosyltransferase involved in cell wall biosynthesis